MLELPVCRMHCSYDQIIFLASFASQGISIRVLRWEGVISVCNCGHFCSDLWQCINAFRIIIRLSFIKSCECHVTSETYQKGVSKYETRVEVNGDGKCSSLLWNVNNYNRTKSRPSGALETLPLTFLFMSKGQKLMILCLLIQMI